MSILRCGIRLSCVIMDLRQTFEFREHSGMPEHFKGASRSWRDRREQWGYEVEESLESVWLRGSSTITYAGMTAPVPILWTHAHRPTLPQCLLKTRTWHLGTPVKYSHSQLTVPNDVPWNPTIAPCSHADESPKVIAMDAHTRLSGSSPNATDANSIPSNGKENSCSCLGVVGMSLVRLAWVHRVVLSLGGHSRKVGRQ